MAKQQCIPMLRALADDTRWRIVHELLAAPATVNELTEKLGASQYNVSRHLTVLQSAGIVEKNRSGKHVHCQIAPDFRQKLSRDKTVLNLGCCTFQFDKPAR
jgi:DNA-binding transcriptional ArsR family regulator